MSSLDSNFLPHISFIYIKERTTNLQKGYEKCQVAINNYINAEKKDIKCHVQKTFKPKTNTQRYLVLKKFCREIANLPGT